jgi:CBS domain-containing protein
MSVTVAEIMSRPALTARPDQAVAEIARQLARRRIGAMPVCDADGTLVGIVSEMDIIRPFRESALQRGEGWLARLAEGEVLSQEFLDFVHRDKRLVADVMTRRVFTTGPDATLPQVAELMSLHALKHLPIVSQGKVAGIVSRGDVLTAIARGQVAVE